MRFIKGLVILLFGLCVVANTTFAEDSFDWAFKVSESNLPNYCILILPGQLSITDRMKSADSLEQGNAPIEGAQVQAVPLGEDAIYMGKTDSQGWVSFKAPKKIFNVTTIKDGYNICVSQVNPFDLPDATGTIGIIHLSKAVAVSASSTSNVNMYKVMRKPLQRLFKGLNKK